MTEAVHGKAAAGLSGLGRVVPLAGMNGVLIVSPQPRYIQAAQGVFALIERERGRTLRVWHVYYLQNSNANDIAYTMQMAFTPNNVTALPQAATRGAGATGGGMAGGGLGGGGRSGGGFG